MPTSNIQVDLAILQEKTRRMDEEFERLERKISDTREEFDEELARRDARIEKLEKDNEELEAMAAKWKGGVAALIALGSFVGMVLSQLDNVRALFFKVH